MLYKDIDMKSNNLYYDLRSSKSGKKPVGIFDGSWSHRHVMHGATSDYDSTYKNAIISDVDTSNIDFISQECDVGAGTL